MRKVNPASTALTSVVTVAIATSAAAAPDLSGFWGRGTFDFEAANSGPAPIRPPPGRRPAEP